MSASSTSSSLASYLLTLVALAAISELAVAANLPSLIQLPAPAQTLSVSFGNLSIQNPGQTFDEYQTTPQPRIGLPASNYSGKFLLLFIDPSFNSSTPSNVALHEIIDDLQLNSNGSLTTTSPPLAPYVYPQVPAGEDAHDYTLLLFQQPQNLSVPAKFDSFLPYPTNLLTRTNFPLLDFINQTGLGSPIAANWFSEGPPSTTTTIPSSNSTSTNSTATDPSPTTSNSTSGSSLTSRSPRYALIAIVAALVAETSRTFFW